MTPSGSQPVTAAMAGDYHTVADMVFVLELTDRRHEASISQAPDQDSDDDMAFKPTEHPNSFHSMRHIPFNLGNFSSKSPGHLTRLSRIKTRSHTILW
ncbi:hypothetical protein CSIM01_03691 [Colletotrichum simmondsii]|uniref:Uncharacterized protein n=1 Tax=Colletotrichum simmondsii TaxID=703756 RepID=A0A135RRH4_9PEZI|nr:hypothetical protein CSIM01_03691 [Colletotrichum simmondsii]